MKFLALAAAFISLLEVSYAAPAIKARDCPSIPSSADPSIRDQVYRITQSRGVTAKVLLATFETAWIESHVNNLPCGDQDSIGVFQQRPSQGWGSYDQIMNVDYSTNKFLDQAIPNDANNPGYTAGQLAQSVQRSEFPDRIKPNRPHKTLSTRLALLLAGAEDPLAAQVFLPTVQARFTQADKAAHMEDTNGLPSGGPNTKPPALAAVVSGRTMAPAKKVVAHTRDHGCIFGPMFCSPSLLPGFVEEFNLSRVQQDQANHSAIKGCYYP
ncbi:carbohydrate-binding domain protein [Ceratobasidium sp. AG-Ba]|nr:carbohydrate-binding domain protein [Ceratobasidium sp. AG-Ba]